MATYLAPYLEGARVSGGPNQAEKLLGESINFRYDRVLTVRRSELGADSASERPRGPSRRVVDRQCQREMVAE